LLFNDAPAAKDREQDGEWELVARHPWVVAYTDGAGFDRKVSPVCQRVGAGAFVCDIDIDNGKRGQQQVKVRTNVGGKQTVPRAEITAMIEPLEGLVRCQAKCNALVVLDAEHVFNTAKDEGLLSAATQGCNADLWKRWQDNVNRFSGTLVLLHVRSHALDGSPGSELRRQQNINRRKYAVPAGREQHRSADDGAIAIWTEHHWPETHMQGNDTADKEASQAQKDAVPSGAFQEEAERWQGNAGLVARRIATIEAHIRNTRTVVQADLKEVAAVPEWVDVLGDVRRTVSDKGHKIQERNGWFECQVCLVRKRKHTVDYFWKKPCRSQPSPELVEIWPGGQSTHVHFQPPEAKLHGPFSSVSHSPDAPLHNLHTRTGPPNCCERTTWGTNDTLFTSHFSRNRGAQLRLIPAQAPHPRDTASPGSNTGAPPTAHVSANPTFDAEDLNVAGRTQREANKNPRKRCAEEVEDPGEIRDGMDDFARQVKERMQRRRQERWENDHAVRTENAAESPIDELATGGGWVTNAIDDPEGDADEEPMEDGTAEMNPLDNPEGEVGEEVAHQEVAEEVAKRRMPQQIRNRIIKLQAKERVARNRAEKNLQKQALRWQAFRTVEAAPSKGGSGLGEGHTCFALGPITFCKVCGGTRSSSGNLLKRACRGWAPPGTMGQVKALLKGRPCSGFHRKLLLKQCTPLRRLACKTRPVVRCQVPRHLVQDDDGSSDELGEAPRIVINRCTVHLGAALGT
jgi:ribonuclease HI